MRQILIIMLFFVVCSAYTQIAPEKYFVEFTDKNGTPYDISHPEQFLSARSIARRTRQLVVTKTQDLPVNPAYVSAVAGTGVTVLTRTKWFNGITIYAADPSALLAISAFPFVKQVTKQHAPGKNRPSGDFGNKFQIESGSSIPGRQIGPVTADYGMAYNQIHMLKGDYLHDLDYKGQGMVIAILDAGFQDADRLPAFDSLRANGQILGTHDFVLPGNDVYREFSHGMSVLSTMGANVPGEMIGTAPEAGFWLFRTEDVASENYIEEYNWVSGAEAADSVGADIINSSLGYTVFDDPRWDHTWSDLNGHTALVTRGANIAASKGIAVINSAGNDGNKPWRYISVPADGDSVLAIGAVDPAGNYASFSSHGLPGGPVKPNVAAPGQMVVVAGTDSTFTYSSGTSFSSPILAGLVACLWQSRPEISVASLYKAIEMSASHAASPDTLTGFGIPDFSVALEHLDIKERRTNINSVYPNPFEEEVTLRCFSKEGEEAAVIMYDNLGRIIFKQTLQLNPRDNYYYIQPAKNCPPGTYILSITSRSFSEKFHLVKIVK